MAVEEAATASAMMGEGASAPTMMGEAMSTIESDDAAVLLVCTGEGWAAAGEAMVAVEKEEAPALLVCTVEVCGSTAAGVPVWISADLRVSVTAVSDSIGVLVKADAGVLWQDGCCWETAATALWADASCAAGTKVGCEMGVRSNMASTCSSEDVAAVKKLHECA